MVKYNSLTQMKAKNLEAGKHADGQGLWLIKRNKLAGKWILRTVIFGKRREMGLGPWPDVSIAEARDHAANARKAIRYGKDPIEERRKQRNRPNRLTVAEAVEGCFKAKQAELKDDGKAGRWLSPLSVHILPKLGQTAIEELDQHALKAVLEPIWHTKPDAARKALNRVNLTLKHAAALDLNVDLQMTLKVRELLGKQRHKPKHIPSMPYREVPTFYKWLCNIQAASAFALRMLILTAARTSEVRLMKLSEIKGDIWHLDPERTKTTTAHRIPLSDEALRIVKQMKSDETDYLFTGPSGKPLSDMAMLTLMKKAEYEYRPHGFRASFRTWLEECTDASYEVKEAALAHKVGSSVERAYQRSDYLEKRTELIKYWSSFLLEYE